MRKFRNFKCKECDKVQERLVDDDVKDLKCDCGGDSELSISAPKYFGNSTGRSPSAM